MAQTIGAASETTDAILPVVNWDGTSLDPLNPAALEKIVGALGPRA